MDEDRAKASRTALKTLSFLLGWTAATALYLYPAALRHFQTPPWGYLSPALALDGAWFAIQTMTTTGYGLRDELWTPELKIVSILLMIVAVPTWSILVNALYRLYPREV